MKTRNAMQTMEKGIFRMAPTVVQLTYRLDLSGPRYEQAIAPLAHAIGDVSGLQWKIWLFNEERQEAAGVCLFDDEPSAEAFMAGALVSRLSSAPLVSQLRIERFSVLTGLSEITRAPIN